jgi:hypothetical protein
VITSSFRAAPIFIGFPLPFSSFILDLESRLTVYKELTKGSPILIRTETVLQISKPDPELLRAGSYIIREPKKPIGLLFRLFPALLPREHKQGDKGPPPNLTPLYFVRVKVSPGLTQLTNIIAPCSVSSESVHSQPPPTFDDGPVQFIQPTPVSAPLFLILFRPPLAEPKTPRFLAVANQV